MEPDEHRVRFQRERIADDVMPARKVEHAMRIDGFLDGRGVVGLTVAGDTQRVNVHPICGGRQRRDRGRQRCGHGGQDCGIVEHADGAGHSLAGQDEPVIEILDPVQGALAGDLFPALAK